MGEITLKEPARRNIFNRLDIVEMWNTYHRKLSLVHFSERVILRVHVVVGQFFYCMPWKTSFNKSAPIEFFCRNVFFSSRRRGFFASRFKCVPWPWRKTVRNPDKTLNPLVFKWSLHATLPQYYSSSSFCCVLFLKSF